jgi:hypothetical protein
VTVAGVVTVSVILAATHSYSVGLTFRLMNSTAGIASNGPICLGRGATLYNHVGNINREAVRQMLLLGWIAVCTAQRRAVIRHVHAEGIPVVQVDPGLLRSRNRHDGRTLTAYQCADSFAMTHRGIV